MDRFWQKVLVRGPDECWDWTAGVDTTGYGSFRYKGQIARAHRVSYELSVGPIPKGEGHHGVVVMHSCDNRLCCNPSHLRLGSHKDNMSDMRDKGRRRGIGAGAANGRSKLTAAQVLAIRADTRGKRVIAAEIGISPAQVQRVRKGLQWTTPEAQIER